MIRGRRRAAAVALSLSNATAEACSTIMGRSSCRFFASTSNLSCGTQHQKQQHIIMPSTHLESLEMYGQKEKTIIVKRSSASSSFRLMKSSRPVDKIEGMGAIATEEEEGGKGEEEMIKTLYVAPHGSCLLFDSKDLLFRFERGEIDLDLEVSTDVDSHDVGGGAFLDTTTTTNPSFCGDATESNLFKNGEVVEENVGGTKNRVDGEEEQQYLYENIGGIDDNNYDKNNNNNATAEFFLNQPATDEGACGLEEAWSEAEKADLAAFVTARAIKRDKPFSGDGGSKNDGDGEEDRIGGREEKEEGIVFHPKGIVRVVDVGCGTGRFSVMWPRLFPKVEEISLVEPCRHFLDAAVSKFEAEYLTTVDDDCTFNEDDNKATSVARGGEGEKKEPSSFGAPVPTYDFFVTLQRSRERSGGIELESNRVRRKSGGREVNMRVGEEREGKQEGPRRIRVIGYQLTVDQYSLIARNAMSARQTSKKKEMKAKSNASGSQTKEQQNGDNDNEEKGEGILITTGVAQYLSDAQIIDLATLEDWTLMKEDVSVSTVSKRQVMEALLSSSPSLQQGGDSIQFQNARVSYRVPMIADLVAKKMHEVTGAALRTPQKKVGGSTCSETTLTQNHFFEKEGKGVHDEGEEISVALCYASDGGTVRTLQQFENIFFGKEAEKVVEKEEVDERTDNRAMKEERSALEHEIEEQQEKEKAKNKEKTIVEERAAGGNEVVLAFRKVDGQARNGNGKENVCSYRDVDQAAKSEMSESESGCDKGIGRCKRRPFYVYCRDIQWNMPDMFYSPLSTWLLRKRRK